MHIFSVDENPTVTRYFSPSKCPINAARVYSNIMEIKVASFPSPDMRKKYVVWDTSFAFAKAKSRAKGRSTRA